MAVYTATGARNGAVEAPHEAPARASATHMGRLGPEAFHTRRGWHHTSTSAHRFTNPATSPTATGPVMVPVLPHLRSRVHARRPFWRRNHGNYSMIPPPEPEAATQGRQACVSAASSNSLR